MFSKPQTPQPQAPQFQMTEQMLITDLPTEASNDFVSVFNSINDSANFKPFDPKNSAEADVEKLKADTTKSLFGNLMSLAHLIDSGRNAVSELRNDLQTSTSDLQNSLHARVIPTPFISRYVSQIERHSQDLSESLASYESRLQPTATSVGMQALSELLHQQNEAVLRCSSQVVQLKSKMEAVRTEFLAKTKLNSTQLLRLEESQISGAVGSCATGIQGSYDQFKAEKAKKLQKRAENSDLFGMSNTPPPAQKPAFSFGGSLGANKTSTGIGTTK